MSQINFRAGKLKLSLKRGNMSIPPPPPNPKNSKLRRKAIEKGEGSSQATTMEVDDQGSQHASPAVSQHIDTLEAEGFADRGKQTRFDDSSDDDDEEEDGDTEVPPFFPQSILGLTKQGRKKMMKKTMSRFPTDKDFEVMRAKPSRAIRNAFDGVMKAGMTLSVLAEDYRKGAMKDVRGLKMELSQARTEIHGLKEGLKSAQEEVKKAKQELADAQEAGKSSLSAAETKLKDALDEKARIAAELKEKKAEVERMKSELTEAREKLERTQEEVIAEWKESPDCADYQAMIGSEAFEAGITDAITHMETAFTSLGLQDSYPGVRDKVRDLVRAAEEEEHRRLLAEQGEAQE